MSFVYLASPYSHADPLVRLQRFAETCRAAAVMMERGAVVFAPIAHSHPISEAMNGRATDHEFWMRQDLPILALANRLVVLMLDGWEDSKGVKEEIDFAFEHGIAVEFTSPEAVLDYRPPAGADLRFPDRPVRPTKDAWFV